jgi:tRNA pseudouridine55 synthase
MIDPLQEVTKETDFKAGTLILIDKPQQGSSFKIVKDIRYWIKKNFQIKEKLKVGHAGTLDPLASGLLLICTGKMTKQISTLQQGRKTYIGSFTFGATTPSFDLETEIDQEYPSEHITEEKLQSAFSAFTGELKQVPPVYSAVKVKGRRAYDFARKDDEVKLKEKIVHVHAFELIHYEHPVASFRVECSKGTYIRSLARDVGKYLASGAYLSSLRRTSVGPYNVNDAFTPAQLQKAIEQAGQLLD